VRLPTYQRLSKEQDRINGLPLDGNWLVTGPPGTGKSVMAIYRAQILRKKKRSIRLLTWSRLLKMYMEHSLDQVDLSEAELSTFDRWFYDWWRNEYRSAPPKVPGGGFYDYDWDEIHRQLGKGPPPNAGVDLLIDEGQDLPSGFYLFVGETCRHLTVFADENQTITDKQSSIVDIRRYARIKDEFELRKNYRNTIEIAKVARHFYSGLPTGVPDLPDAQDEPGRVPEIRHVTDLTASALRVARHSRTNATHEIGVFLPTVSMVKRYAKELEKAGASKVQTYFRPPKGPPPDIEFDKPGILVTWVKNSKGLEFDTVFVPELNQWKFALDDPQTTMLLYVLSSRARSQLEFQYSGPGEPEILRLFPHDLMERR
jgi:superfamily I DNA/RNA helicase